MKKTLVIMILIGAAILAGCQRGTSSSDGRPTIALVPASDAPLAPVR